MKNYKLKIQYDGTGYSGWQIQNNAPTIQAAIINSLQIITKEEINLIGSGRTDAGVHALGQIANFRTGRHLDIRRVQHSLNSILPKEISILKFEETNETFHSRFDAKKRSYIYLFSKKKSPFYHNYSYFYHHQLEILKLNKLSESLLGEHNFTSFARKNTETENKVCTIYNIGWKETRGIVLFYIEADRFLHGMVRTITGTLLRALKENQTKDYLLTVLNKKDRESAGEAVPAKGLFLYKVKY